MPSGDPGRVLVIEDDPGAQANLCDVLALHGYIADAAGSFAEAFGDKQWHATVAIILERNLPGGTADELLPRLKTMAPHARIIVVTGYPDPEGTIAALRCGAADHPLTPLDPEALRASLARVEEHRCLRRDKAPAEEALRGGRDFARALVNRAQVIGAGFDARGGSVGTEMTCTLSRLVRSGSQA